MSRLLLALVLPLLFAPAAADAQMQFDFIAPTTTVPLAPGETQTTFLVSFMVHQTDGPIGEGQGFGMGVMHDPSVLTVTDIEYGAPLLDDSWGTPTFFSTQEYANGWTAGVVFSFLGTWTLAFETPQPVIDISYTANGVTVGDSVDLVWTNTLGTPPVQNNLVVGGASIPPTAIDGTITFSPAPFVRGDMNTDGGLNIADVFAAEDYIFLGGDTPDCLAALDSNSDNQVDIADIIFLLTYLFLAGDTPGAPFPSCGPAPQESLLGCDAYNCP